jgi:hypothetical protein
MVHNRVGERLTSPNRDVSKGYVAVSYPDIASAVSAGGEALASDEG